MPQRDDDPMTRTPTFYPFVPPLQFHTPGDGQGSDQPPAHDRQQGGTETPPYTLRPRVTHSPDHGRSHLCCAMSGTGGPQSLPHHA